MPRHTQRAQAQPDTNAIASRKRERRLLSMEEGLGLLFHREEDRLQRFVSALWQNWAMIMGEELAAQAFPLGHKDKVLVIGAEDNMSMQELVMQTPEILERVNAFMDCEHFVKVKINLIMGQNPLTVHQPRRSSRPYGKRIPPRPPRLGKLGDSLDPASPVAQCYEAYVSLYDSLAQS
jgi:hypothetical protein